MQTRSLVLTVIVSLFPLTQAVAKPRPPLPPLPEAALQLWHFDATNWFAVEPAPPVEALNVLMVESWSGYAPRLAGTEPAMLRFPAVDTAGRVTLSPAQGSVRFWFCPQWSSASLGGTGPGTAARLIEVGAFTADASLGWWALWLSADGDSLHFSAQAAGQTATFLSAPVQWRSNQWRQVVLTYSAERSLLFIDGQAAGLGAGVSICPDVAVLALGGFGVGSDGDGAYLAQGAFDELATFARPLSEREITMVFRLQWPTARLGPITPEEEEAKRLARLARVNGLATGEMSTLSSDPPLPPGWEEGDFGTNAPAPPPSWEGGCTNGPALIPVWLDNATLRLDLCGRPAGVVYDLLVATNLVPTVYWAWVREVAANVSSITLTDQTNAGRFYRLRGVPDLDGDGLRDFLYPEQEGQGYTTDADNDNDGIPNAIETGRSDPNDPTSLPPPNYYVSTNMITGADGSRDLPFTNLLTALLVATNYSVIQVMPGVYSGPSNRNLSFGTKKLVLTSERGWEHTFIDCGDGANRAFSFTTTNQDYQAQIIGFTITNAGRAAVLCLSNASPTIVNCQFLRNSNNADGGGALICTNASPVFLNCRFITNAATTFGGALLAHGATARPRLSHCTLSDNTRANNGGQVYATGGALVTLHNCIVWDVRSNLGAELVAGQSTNVAATYCDVRGGFTGTDNLNNDPQFETNGTRRLQLNSPCLDQGNTNSFPGFHLFTRHDMDGEARLDREGVANALSPADIGADEFVYRIQFPTVAQTVWVLGANGLYRAVTNQVSEVDEASGVAYLGANATGPLIAVVDDEDRNGFRIYQLNSDANAVQQSVPVSTLNSSYSGGDQEIGDMEGLTFDSATGSLYLITSQTRRNRFRDVDSSPPVLDPVIDPPSNDYDRRRSVLMRLTLDSSLTNATGRSYFESEQVAVPYNTGHLPTSGLAAYLREQFTNNPALREYNFGNKVLIAWNTVNKFGTPVNGVAYASNTALPYPNGGTSGTAGTSLGIFDTGGAGGTNVHSGRTAGSTNFYKIWAVDAQNNYYEGPTAIATNNGIPRIYINEFDAAGNNETIEFYNPSPVAVSLAGCYKSDATPPLTTNHSYKIPVATAVPGRGVLTINDDVWSGVFHWEDNGSENIFLIWTNGTTRIDEWNMKDPDEGGVDFTQGRVWDGGPRGFTVITQDFASCLYETRTPASPYSPNLGALNLTQPRKFFDAVADIDKTKVHLVWGNIGLVPGVWNYSPKQHDFHSINIEDIAFRSANEMVFGLRAPLVNRTTGNAYYFVATDLSAFLPANGWSDGQVSGISGANEMDLAGLGIRSIKWCPAGLTNSQGTQVARYLVLAGSANGGPLVRERLRQKFSLYTWDGSNSGGVAHPQLLISDLTGYAVRPEGVDLIQVNGQWRILFVEDRFQSTGYATRNAVHWPITILGNIQ